VPASPQGEAKKGACIKFSEMEGFCSPRPIGGEAAEQRDAGEGVGFDKMDAPSTDTTFATEPKKTFFAVNLGNDLHLERLHVYSFHIGRASVARRTKGLDLACFLAN
jgi:hypothetical protein